MKTVGSAKTLRKCSGSGLIRVTDQGKLVANILPGAIYDDEEDIAYMMNPEFWQIIRKSRVSDEGLSLGRTIKDVKDLIAKAKRRSS